MRKKFTMLLAALSLAVGTAWALPTEGQLYRIKNVVTGYYLDITSTQTNGIKNCAFDKFDMNQCFYFIPMAKDDNVYYIKSANNQYVATDNNHFWNMRATDEIPSSNTSAEITLVSIAEAVNQYYLQTNSVNSADDHYIAPNNNESQEGAIMYSDKDENSMYSKWEIIEVTEDELTTSVAALMEQAEAAAANACLSASDAPEKAALSTAIATAKGLGDDAKIEDITAAIAALQPAIDAAQLYIQLNDITYVTALGTENSNHPLIVSTKRSDWGVGNNATSMSTISKLGLAASAIDAKQQFAIITPDNGVNHYIYSIKAKRFLKKDNTFGAQGDAIQLNDASANGENRVQFQFKGTSLYINVDNSNPRRLLIDGWDDVDDGNACEVRMHNALTFDLTEALDVFNNHAVINVTYKLGDKKATTSEYKSKGETYNINNPYGFTSVVSCTNNGEALAANNGAYSFEITGDANVVVEIQENLPFTTTTITDGNFAADTEWYLLRQRWNDHYWEHDAADAIVKVKNGGYSIYEAKQLWCFTGNAIDGFKVYNKAAGATFSLNNASPAKLVENNTAVWEVHPSTQSFTADDARFGLGRPGQTGNNQYANLQSNSLKSWSLDAGSTTNAISVSAQYAEIAANWEKLLTIEEGAIGSLATTEGFQALIDAYKANPSQETENAVNEFIAANDLELESDKYYMIVSAYDAFKNNQGVEKAIYSDNSDLKWATRDNASKAYYWQAVTVDGQLRFKNCNDGSYMAVKTTTTESSTSTDIVMWNGEASEDASVSYNAKFEVGTTNVLTQLNINLGNGGNLHANSHSNGGGNNGDIIFHGSGANGASAWRLIKSEDPDLAAAKTALKNKIDELNQYVNNATGKIGYYNAASTETLEAIGKAEDVLNSGGADNTVYETAAEELNTVIAGLDKTIVLPSKGNFYRFKRPGTDVCMLSDVAASKNNRLAMGTNKVSSIFYYGEDGTLLSYANGQYLPAAVQNGNWTCLAVGSVAPTVTFGAGYELGTLGFYLGSDESRAYYSGNYEDGYVNAGGNMANQNKGYDWTIEEVTWLPVAMNAEIGYATLYSPVELALSYGRVKAYTGTVNGDWLTLNEQEVVPANKGVVLVLQKGAEVENGYTFLQVQESTVKVKENAFKGTLATKVAPTDEGTIYTLQAYDETKPAPAGYTLPVAFMEYYDEENENIPNLKGFRAYLPLEGGQNAIGIRFEGTTDIEHSEIRNQHSEMIFDLLGRRVEAITKGGIYIVNGKKVVVK